MTEKEAEEGFLPIESPEDAFRGPTHEPILTQLDKASRQILLDSIYEYGWVKSEDGSQVRIRVGVKYPDLEKAMCYAASHLNMNMNFRRHHADSLRLRWNGLFFRPLFNSYEDNLDAIYVLNILDAILERSLIESIDGSHQAYNVKMAGAHRILETGAQPKGEEPR